MAKKTSLTSSTPSTPRKRAAKKPNGAAADPVVSPQTPPDVTDDDIRVRAYHRYLERGGSHGADFDDWVEAEKDLKSSRS
jgi:hypothetical protein